MGLLSFMGFTFGYLMFFGMFAFDCLLSSAYFLLPVVLRISGYFLDRFGIVLLRLIFSRALRHFLSFFLVLVSGMPIDSIVLLQSIMPFTGCPVYERSLPFDSCSLVIFLLHVLKFLIFLCSSQGSLIPFHIICIHHVSVMSLPEVFLFRGFLLCAFTITLLFLFFNPECCIN